MSEATIWCLLAGGAVVLELLTGTFYLLMISLGLAAAAVGAHAGLDLKLQLLAAAIVGGGAVALWHLLRERNPSAPSASANKDVNLDIGETVHVRTWSAEGQAKVRYRGAEWTAQLAAGAQAVAGPQKIVEVVGNRLVVQPA